MLTVHQVAVGYTGNAIYLPHDASAERARGLGQQLTDKVLAALGTAPPQVTVRAVIRIAAEELLNASKDADMLVVGSRGLGGFTRLLLGSVSTQVTHHAQCPVVVVPAEGR